MDVYTKAVLTVIAAALLVIALKDMGILGTAVAQTNSPTRVTLCTDDGSACGFGANFALRK